MIKVFLNAKHWQLFLLLFVIPGIIQLILMGYNLVISVILSIAYLGVFLGWFWAVGIGLQEKIPENIKMRVRRFKFFFFITVIYILLFFVTIMIGSTNNKLNQNITTIIFPLHIFAMFCIFYCLYFVAKTIKTVELQRETLFKDFAGEFFLIWFYPIGIWFIQPRINKISFD